MLEIRNSKAINKGALLSTLDVYVPSWNLILKDIKVFEKGVKRWISLPSKEIVGKEGERVFIELVAFDSRDAKDQFAEKVLSAFKLHSGETVTPEPTQMRIDKPKASIPF